MNKTNDPIQQQLIDARRSQILDAATQVFAAKGYHRATIRDIARVAGIADGTIYTYFANKGALVLGLMERLNQSDERPAHFAQAAGDDPRHFVRSYIRQRMALLAEHATVFRAVLPELLADAELRAAYREQTLAPTMAIAEQFLTAQMASGVLRPLDTAATARILAGIVLGVLLLHLLDDAYLEQEWGLTTEVMTTVVLDGLLPKEEDHD